MVSTAYEREMSTPPMFLQSMALLYLYLFQHRLLVSLSPYLY